MPLFSNRHVLALISAIVFSAIAHAEPTAEVQGQYRGVLPVAHFDISPPLRDITPLPVPEGKNRGGAIIDPYGFPGAAVYGPQDIDQIVQDFIPTQRIPAPIISFDGPPNLASVAPPDPVGDVGMNHYVVMSNLFFQIYDKSGVSMFGPAANNTLWSGFGGACETENAGDPIVLHDQINDRWMLSQFTAAGAPYFICVAISQTADPTDSYYRYAFSTGNSFPDYPKFGIWTDAYYFSTREFGDFGNNAIGAYALNRADLLAGNPSAQVISFIISPGSTPYNIGDGLLPADLDGEILPPVGSPQFFVGSMDNGGIYGAPQDALTLWKFVADFANPPESSFTLTDTIPIAAYDTVFPCSPGSRACIPQPDTTRKIDIQSYQQRPLHRLAYRNLGTHEALITNQSVEAAAGIGGIRWWELRDPNGTPVIFQEGTYAPGAGAGGDDIHRWMGSAAMDSAGNIALGYSAASASTFPSVWYAGRLASDPAGQMTQGEGSIVDGTGSQTASQRWGDYSSMNIDPVDDCTFWYVNEYLPTTSSVGWQLRIGAFRFEACGAPGFVLSTPVASISSCLTDPVSYPIDVIGFSGYNQPVTLAVSSIPPSATAGFSQNPVNSLPGATTLTLGNTGTVGNGTFNVTVNGTAPGTVDRTLLLQLKHFNEAPAAPMLSMPADNAMDVVTSPTFNWSGSDTESFTIELATDAAFANIIYNDTISGTTVVPDIELMTNTEYFWRVGAANICGMSPHSQEFSFRTLAAPGECPFGLVPEVVYSDDIENGDNSWTHNGTGDTWTRDSQQVNSGAFAWHAITPGSISDQRLVSPAIMLPNQFPLVLRYYNWKEMSNMSMTCLDGAILEISTDDGASWIQFADTALLTDPYFGDIQAGTNPLAGLSAWCSGEPYVESVVDLTDYAGETARFRYRVGTDDSFGNTGWFIDDVQVQSCVTDNNIFNDGFESP